MASGVSIVIPSWNGIGLLQRFFPSVLAAARRYRTQSGAPTEIIVVDDGSTDETAGWLVGQGFQEEDESETPRRGEREMGRPELRFARNKRNLGFGETCNRGFELAAHPLVFLLNNDVEADADCIAPLVENFNDVSVFAAHCRVFEFDSGRECGTGKLGSFSKGFIRVHRSYAAVRASRPQSAAGAVDQGASRQQATVSSRAASQPEPLFSMFAGGGSAMFDRQKFLELGGFEPLLSPFYWEDVELSYRAWKRGYTVMYEPRSVARHRISSTIGKLSGRKVRTIEQRNRLIFHWINLHDGRMLASHIAWVLLLGATAPLRFEPGFLLSVAAAIRALPQIRKRRRREKEVAERSDRGVFEVFTSLEEV
ncbi:MAG: glycosyltransferase [Blastocatellia bacterium]